MSQNEKEVLNMSQNEKEVLNMSQNEKEVLNMSKNEKEVVNTSHVYPGLRKVVKNVPERLLIDDKKIELPPKTVGEMIDKYAEELNKNGQQQQFSSCQSVICKYVVPALKEESPAVKKASKTRNTSSKRITSQKILEIRDHLRTIPLEKDFDLVALAEPFMSQLDNKEKNQKLYYLRALMKWVMEKNWLIQPKTEQQVYSFKESRKSRPYPSDLKLTNKGKVKAYILGSHPSHNDSDGYLINPEFEATLQNFRDFLQKELNHRLVTANFNIGRCVANGRKLTLCV
jgi:6-pyruvoyl-tetrahydropterin synthase